tara:strand:+ start:65 stop:247 length:183 start_codon:yes stop_codon:yes gene_type:complete
MNYKITIEESLFDNVYCLYDIRNGNNEYLGSYELSEKGLKSAEKRIELETGKDKLTKYYK